MNRKSPNDEKIEKLTAELKQLVKKHQYQKNNEGKWFSNNQLNLLRGIYETNGYKFARLFLRNKVYGKEGRVLLGALDEVEKCDFELGIASFILGNLNSIIK